MAKLERTRRILGTRTATETIDRALDLVAEEAALVQALRDFVVKGGRRARAQRLTSPSLTRGPDWRRRQGGATWMNDFTTTTPPVARA